MKAAILASASAICWAGLDAAPGTARAQARVQAPAASPAQTPPSGTPSTPEQDPAATDSLGQPAPPAGSDDILVTARKRSETSIAAPIVVTAFGGAELERRGITNLDGVARITPQLLVGNQAGSIQGGNVAIRGVSGPDALILADQAVAFNIDGVAVSKSSVRRLSTIDLAQVEVLKGPQALLYGKNSPGGVISITTADPTDHFEARVLGGYEFNGREVRGEGYVSGPLTDTLGLRVAAFGSHLKGYLKDAAPDTSPYKQDDRNPRMDEVSTRATLRWAPGGGFQARLKFNYGRIRNNGLFAGVEYNYCPGGVRPAGFAQDAPCSLGGRNVNAGYSPQIGGLLPQRDSDNYFRDDGRDFQIQRQYLTSLEMNYELTEHLTLTSTTGYYRVYVNGCSNQLNDYVRLAPSCNGLRDHQVSEEARLTSSFGGLADFVAGGFYGRSSDRAYSLNVLQTAASPGAFTPVQNYNIQQRGEAYSGFAQLIVRPVPVVELDLGGRYSHEMKRVPFARRAPAPVTSLDLTLPGAVFVPGRPRIAFNDFSPEATASWRPTGDLTLFASYKRGFLSGGYNIPGTAPSGTDLSYGPEKIRGFEAGVKTRLLNRALRVNLAAYDYEILGLQVTNFVNALTQTRNATSTRLKGVEGDFTFQVADTGADLHGSAAYNHADYGTFSNAPCYVGQTPAQGCSVRTVNGTTGPFQFLSGAELVRAPRWTLGGGVGYDRAAGDGLRLRLSVDGNYSGGYFADVSEDPNSRQRAYALLDASARLVADRGWEAGLVGRNLTNHYYLVADPAVPFTGGGTGTAAGFPAARFGSVSRGREILLQLGYKFEG